MNPNLDVLMILLLDPCLTADEAAREAEARIHTASAANEARMKPAARGRTARRREPADIDGPAMGF
jgi:hypothetical protein